MNRRRSIIAYLLLFASRKDEYLKQLKSKRPDLSDEDIENILDMIMDLNNPKKEKVAVFWICKKSLILPEDQDKLDQAFNLIEKQHLDYQEFEGPMFVINRNDRSTKRILNQDQKFDPNQEPTFSNRKDLGNGVVVYLVDDSKEGQRAVRKAIDVNWGYDKNPWCLAARKSGFSQEEIAQLTEEQKEQLGLYSDDELATAWSFWSQRYAEYPKRICFKGGELMAFSAGDEKDLVEWWDKNDKSHKDFKELTGVKDDSEFLNKYGKISWFRYGDLDEETVKKLANDEELNVRKAIAEREDIPSELVEKLANDEYFDVRYLIAKRKDLPTELIEKLANDEDWQVRCKIAKRKDLPLELIEKLDNDEDSDVRCAIAERKDLNLELIEKLANDEDWQVRWKIAGREDLTSEIIKKFANDRRAYVRCAIAYIKDLSPELIEKLANDKSVNVRYAIADRKDLSPELIEKLANDKSKNVRDSIRRNYNV